MTSTAAAYAYCQARPGEWVNAHQLTEASIESPSNALAGLFEHGLLERRENPNAWLGTKYEYRLKVNA